MGMYTLRGLSPEVAARLKDEAQRRGVSVNRLLQALVQEGLGIDRPRRRRHLDLDPLAGTWTRKDEAEFVQATEAFERVDEELWR